MKTILLLLLICTTEISWDLKTYHHMGKLTQALEYYFDDCGVYPTNEEGLIELLSSTKTCWNGPYILEKMLKDKVSGEYYKYISINDSFEVISSGIDGLFNTEDDFSSLDDEKIKQKTINNYSKKNSEDTKAILISTVALMILLLFWLFKKVIKKVIKDRH